VLAHTEGHEGNLLIETQIRSFRAMGSLNGPSESASYWPPLVSLRPSLWLLWVVLTHLTGFALEPSALAGPSTIVGPILDTVVASLTIEGASCGGLVWRVKLVFTVPFYSVYRAQPLCLLGCYTMGYKVGGCSFVQPTSSRTISDSLLASFPPSEKKKT
jgi:hypothetical protein